MATVASGLIARPRLAHTLVDALDAGSVLLVAGPGYGKTLALEEALALSNRRSLWIPCGDAGDAGRLLMSVVEGLRFVVPGLADVLGDRLAAGLEPVDVRSASGALMPELERLLVEPLVIVFDDAEELEHDRAALSLVDQLVGLRAAPLSVAVATRRSLRLKIAKLRAAGRIAEIGPGELSFSASECEELLRLRHGRMVSEEEVEAVVAASEGWPMGVALSGLTGSSDAAIGALPRAELFRYLAEEVLDRLDPGMRAAVLDSSVPDTLTSELATALGLPHGFLIEAERSGLFMRRHDTGARSYHPLFRAFLRERLLELRSDTERAALHARAAAGLASAGRHAEAIENWLAAGRPDEALALLSSEAAGLVRTSPTTVASWLSAIDPTLGRESDYLFLEAQLLWGAGQHERAVEPFAEAVSGYARAGDTDREWIARAFLADTLIFVGEFEAVCELACGWDRVGGPVAGLAAAAVAWYQVAALSGLGRLEDADVLRERLLRDPATAAQFIFLDVVSYAGVQPGAGRAREAIERLRSAIAQLELSDPQGRLPYVLGMVVIVLRDLGERAAALEWLDRTERESERVGLGFVARDSRLQRAALLAQAGDLPGAELELARAGKRDDTGWRGVHEAEAEAQVAILRGDGPAAAAAAQRALGRVARGPVSWRVWATVDMAQVLAQSGSPEIGRSEIEATLAVLDERFPEERGRVHRARLLASRACIEYETGEPGPACESMRMCWADAGEQADQIVRAHWPVIQPVLWHALAEGALTPEAVLPAMQHAFPGGDALVAMVDHPEPAVRRAALLAALASSHPAVLAQLTELDRDRDEQVAAAAVATRERLRGSPPPLRFELLGGFRLRRAGWEIDEAAWQRPMAVRVVRFLLIQGSSGVPEDTLFDAFWPDRPADSARQHLAQAVSRARKVLDLPGAEQSVIEAKERTYRLRLRERDSVDADQFEAAAAGALAGRGRELRAALEAAAALWTGEPLPEDRYAPWTFAWRERLVQTYSHVLNALVETYEASGEHHAAIRAASRLLEQDPLNERAHVQLMAAYARTGQKSQALRQFLECRRALVSELGVEPSAQTSALQARILAGDPV